MTLPSRVEKLLALPPSHEHSSMIVYAGHEAESARLAPLHKALVEQVDSIISARIRALSEMPYDDIYMSVKMYDRWMIALARLEAVVKEMEK